MLFLTVIIYIRLPKGILIVFTEDEELNDITLLMLMLTMVTMLIFSIICNKNLI